MKGELRDMTRNTMIGHFPTIVNNNNRVIRSEFNNIYDSDKNVLIKSVAVPSGSVKAHWGEFVNLKCQSIQIESSNVLDDLQIEIDHNKTNKRFVVDYINSEDGFNPETDSAHDIGMIMGLQSELNKINSQLEQLWVKVSVKDGTQTVYGSSQTGPSTYSVPQKTSIPLETDTPLSRKRLQKPQSTEKITISPEYLPPAKTSASMSINSEYIEAKNSAIIFKDTSDKNSYEYENLDSKNSQSYRYINVEGKRYIKVDNLSAYSLHSSVTGQTINLILEKVPHQLGDFYIKLKSGSKADDYKNLVIEYNDADLAKVELIAVDYSDAFGTIWELHSYSGNINIH